jgi:cobalamin biosynthesis Mg chelatase CobN
VFRSPISRRACHVSLVLLAAALLAGAVVTDANAKTKTCAQQVLADWYDDGRISKIYPLPCYPAAIALLGRDAKDYTNAPEEIGRAYAYAKLGKQDPGAGAPPAPTDTTTATTTGPVKTGTVKTDTTNTAKTDTVETETETELTSTETTQTDTSGPSSVPIPLLVLGGLAVILLAAGSAGYFRRRMNGDGDDDGTAAPPPAT